MHELKIKSLSPAKSPKRLPSPPLVSRVRVAVRVRPPTRESGDSTPPLCISKADPESTGDSDENALQCHLEKTSKTFRFDHVFQAEAVQNDVYDQALKPMLASLLHGFNVTVLAYGQTGSGKTYTMGGASSNSDGLIPRFLNDIFAALRSESSAKTTAKVTFIEIYCDEIRDLLADSSESSRRGSISTLTMHEDADDVWIDGLQQVQVKTVDEALQLLSKGRQRQTNGAHALNDQSSRSHAVYTLEISRAFATEIKRAKLTFVDLAGSERIKKTMVEGQRMKESIQINVGLLALGNVINALGNKQRSQRRNSTGVSGRRGSLTSSDSIVPNVTAHVPYRSSKLTRLLRDALGGNSVTLFVACVSPEIANSGETLCTLQYANRARSIQNRAQKNVEEAPAEDVVNEEPSLKRGTATEREVYSLRAQVAALKLQLEQATIAAAEVHVAIDTQPPESRSPKVVPLEVNFDIGSQTDAEADVTETHILSDAASGAGSSTREVFNSMLNGAAVSSCDNGTQTELSMTDIDFLEKLLANKTRRDPPPQTSIAVGTPPPQIEEQSTQYEPPLHLQIERKSPIDYVLLSPSEIFREVHHLKQVALGGAPSPWPHRRRLDGQPNFPKQSPRSIQLSTVGETNRETSNQQYQASLKTPDIFQNLLNHAQNFFRNEADDSPSELKSELDNPKVVKATTIPMSLDTFLKQMRTLFEQRSHLDQVVQKLTQRFRHLSNVLGAEDTESKIHEISKYALTHRQRSLQQQLETCEQVAAERLWRRLQHREVALDNCDAEWEGIFNEVFLSQDQYDACQPWHAHLDNHEFFQHCILPFILNGWISVTPSDVENEQLWLTL